MGAVERFLRYVTFETTSDELSPTCPSTDKQKLLGAQLVEELLAMGLTDACMDENGYVYAHLAASVGREAEPTIALIAHMDTSPAASGANVRPARVTYTGGDLPLANGCIDLSTTPQLTSLIGEELIVTDGTTLLGADDKAGIAEIMEAVACLTADTTLSHPRVSICFTPDEEIGRGADKLDMVTLGADYGYTVDGGTLGELEYENFNAAGATLTFRGVNIHPGSAKGIMKNALLMAAQFITLLPADETPAHTEGYEGFYHVTEMRGDENEAYVSLIIRDHDRTRFEARKETVKAITAKINTFWGGTYATADISDSYYNMREMVEPYMFLIDHAKDAFTACGVTPCIQPIRGGTDGARLSYMGLPCPNLSTGGINFHSVRECIPVKSLETMVDVLLKLLEKTCPNK